MKLSVNKLILILITIFPATNLFSVKPKLFSKIDTISLQIKNLEGLLNRCAKYGADACLVTIKSNKRTGYIIQKHHELEQLRSTLSKLQEFKDAQEIQEGIKEFEKYLKGPCSYKDRKLKGCK